MPSVLPFAAVVLAGSATPGDADMIASIVQVTRALGAAPVVVVIPRGMTTPEGARGAHVAPSASRISGLRAGMALLSNTPARYALLVPVDAATGGAAHADAASLTALVDELTRAAVQAPMTALAGGDLDRVPVMIARDSWLELMTLGEQGMDAVAARRGIRRV